MCGREVFSYGPAQADNRCGRETAVTSTSALPRGWRQVISLEPAEVIEREGTSTRALSESPTIRSASANTRPGIPAKLQPRSAPQVTLCGILDVAFNYEQILNSEMVTAAR